jgi:hypothetical protein
VANVYNRTKFRILNGTTDFDTLGTGALTCLLMRNGTAFNPDNNFVADIVADEISVGGYARQVLTGVAVSEDDTNDRGEVQANQATFTALASGQTVTHAVVVHRIGASDTDASDTLVAYYNVTDTATNGGDIIIRFNSATPGALLRVNET